MGVDAPGRWVGRVLRMVEDGHAVPGADQLVLGGPGAAPVERRGDVTPGGALLRWFGAPLTVGIEVLAVRVGDGSDGQAAVVVPADLYVAVAAQRPQI